MTAYPFDQARRLEFQAGATQVSFDQAVQTEVYSLATGQRISSRTDRSSAGDSITIGTTAAAFVSDTSAFGATSPVLGERYRFEVGPTFGTLRYTNVLADYRRYFMPAPFYTLAGRVLHFGRYGSGGEDQRLYPLSVGYPTLVRGYDVYSIGANECVPDATSQCPVFDQLFGSRMLVGNLEFRFPLLRPFVGSGRNMYSAVPVEVGVFADGGVAWNRGQSPSLFGGDRHGVSSAGITLRVNMFGAAVGEFDIARPFQRPAAGWTFQFNFTPGF